MALASPKERFDAAVRVIQSLPKNGSFQPSHAMMLTFYGLFKQASNGPCSISRPYMWDVVGRAKWDAWNRLGTMPKEQAMLQYVEELKKIIETMPHTENVQEFIETLGNFYELIDDGSASGPMASVIRKNFSPKRTSPSRDDQEIVDDKVTNGHASAFESSSNTHESSPTHPSQQHNGSHKVADDFVTGELTDSQHASHISTVTNGYHPTVNSEPNIIDSSHKDLDNLTHTASSDSNSATVTQEVGAIDNFHVSLPSKLSALAHTSGSSDRVLVDSDALSSDGEEFCDTCDVTSLTVECSHLNVVPSAPFKGQSDDVDDRSNGIGSDAVASRGGGDVAQSEGRTSYPTASGVSSGSVFQGISGNVSFTHHSTLGPDQLLGVGGSGSGGAEGGGGPVYGMPLYVGSAGTVEQIAVALVRLQQDMNNVLTRLQTLESLAVTQQQIATTRHQSVSHAVRDQVESSRSNTSWWRPFTNLRMSSVVFLVAWPLIVHLVLRLIANRRRRLNRR